jgi:hypothetical protein
MPACHGCFVLDGEHMYASVGKIADAPGMIDIEMGEHDMAYVGR